MKYSIRFARNTDIDNIQQETVHAVDEQTARNMFTCCDCYVYSCEMVLPPDRDDADILRAAHAAGFPDAVLYDTHPLTPELVALNKAAGYDIVSAICTKSSARIEWEKQYLAKRETHHKKYFAKPDHIRGEPLRRDDEPLRDDEFTSWHDDPGYY